MMGSFSFLLYHIVNISTIINFKITGYNFEKRRAVAAIIDYAPLWDTMREKGITQYQLLKAGIDNKTLDGLKKNKNITLLTLEKLCRILQCEPKDVFIFTNE